MRLTLDYSLSLEENASLYYDKSKKAKKKVEGVQLAIDKAEKDLKKLHKTIEDKSQHADAVAQAYKAKAKKAWFEKFRWFYTSQGHLAVGGRDASTNEVLIKKHLVSQDIVFHTDMAGSPFFVLKLEKDTKATDSEIQELAQATFLFSRASNQGLSSADVFWVLPEQVTKTANPGESLATGAFVIKGKTTYVNYAQTDLGVYLQDHKVIVAPLDAVPASATNVAIVSNGKLKPSDAAKKIIKIIGGGLADEVIRALPSRPLHITKR